MSALTGLKNVKNIRDLRLVSCRAGSVGTQGFTLIELMIATGILSITVMATMSLMQIMNRQSNYQKSQIEVNQITAQFEQYLSNPSICSNTFRGYLPGQFINSIALSRDSTGNATANSMSGLGTDASSAGAGQRYGEWILSSIRILDPYAAADDALLQQASTRYGFTPFLAPTAVIDPGATNAAQLTSQIDAMTQTGYVQAVIEINLRHNSMNAQDDPTNRDIGRFGGATKQIFVQTLARFGRLVTVQGVNPGDVGYTLGTINDVSPKVIGDYCDVNPTSCPCDASVSLDGGSTLGVAAQENQLVIVGAGGVSDTRYSVEGVSNNGADMTMACFAWNMRQPLAQCGSASNITQK